MAIDWDAEVLRLEALTTGADPTVAVVKFPDGREFQFDHKGGQDALAYAKAQAAASDAAPSQATRRTFCRPRAETW